MSNDTFTTTTSRSWFSRIGSAIGGILFGVILFFGSFVLLTWNEGRAIKREKTLQFGAGQVVPVTADEVVAANQGKLVHFSGTAVAADPVSDPGFGIGADALKLRRDVEMYQWDQSEKSTTKQKLGGGEETTTTYSYSKKWSSSLIDSSRNSISGVSNGAGYYLGTITIGSNGDVNFVAIPEPSTALLALGGAVTAAFLARRRRQTSTVQ